MPGCKLIAPILSLVDLGLRPVEETLANYLLWLKGQGVDGLLVMGTTGEFAHFSVAERMAYLDAVAACAPGLPLMVNIGASALSDTLALQTHAVNTHGVESVLWMPPFYFPADALNGLPQMIHRLLETQPETIPFYLYHHPAMSQISVIPQLLDVSPRVAGAKDSSGQWETLAQAIVSHPQQAFFAGTDFAVSKAQAIACDGVIGGLLGLFPQLFVAARRGEVSAEKTLQALRGTMKDLAKMPAMKAWVNAQGFGPAVSSALPFADLSVEASQALVRACKEILDESSQTL